MDNENKCYICDKRDTKYSCCSCFKVVCNICAVSVSESTDGYCEENYRVGKCPTCCGNYNEKEDESIITISKVKISTNTKQKSIFASFGLTRLESKATDKPVSTAPKTSDTTPRSVSRQTAEKWKSELAKYYVHEWLTYTVDKSSNATDLKCKYCITYEKDIKDIDGFNNQYIIGSKNYRKSSVLSHGRDSKAHARAYELHLKNKNESTDAIAKKLTIMKHGGHGSGDITTAVGKMTLKDLEQTKRKFQAAYFVAKEEMSLKKYESLLNYETLHGVSFGESYRNRFACAEYVNVIGEDLKQQLSLDLAKATFFSVLCDGSTDTSVKENEVIYVLYFDPVPAGSDSVQVKLGFLSVKHLSSQCAGGVFSAIEGSFNEIKESLQSLGIQDYTERLVGFTSDGASVNRGKNESVKQYLRRSSPWLIFIWCIAHRLELALKDALSDQSDFTLIDDILLKLFYLYNKAPKKLHQLEDLYKVLKESIEFDEGGLKPKKASGTRWITHKVNAMKVVLDKWGVFITHLEKLTTDRSILRKDQCKIIGYLKVWKADKVPLLLAMFIDLLQIAANLSLSFQKEEVDHVNALSSLEKAKRSLKRFEDKQLEDLPHVKNVLKKLEEKNGCFSYQGIVLQNVNQAKEYVRKRKNFILKIVNDCISERLEHEEESSEYFSIISTVLNCEGWSANEVDFIDAGIEKLFDKFHQPLLNGGISCSVPDLIEQWHKLVEYAVNFLNVNVCSYRNTWRKLFTTPNSAQWNDMLIMIRLLFTIPISNAKLERLFSKLKRIKTAFRSSLGFVRLENLLRILEEGPPIEEYDPTSAIELWASQKNRRLNQKPRNQYKSHEMKRKADSLDSSDSEVDFDFEECEEFAKC